MIQPKFEPTRHGFINQGCGDWEFEETPDGQYIFYEDHKEIVNDLLEKIESLTEAIRTGEWPK